MLITAKAKNMIIGTCKRCKNEVPALGLSEEQRLEVWGLLVQDFKLFAIKKIMDAGGYSHRDAKIIVDHLNVAFGKCNRCNFGELKGENTPCPKCKSFNYNLNIAPPFDQDFCVHLESALKFEGLQDENVKGFWCDGISHLPADMKALSRSKIEKDKEIKTKAWIGKDGQDEYEMTIRFGDKSIENYKNNRSLVACIPAGDCRNWIEMNPGQKKIRIWLT